MSYEELRENLMTREQFEELTKVDEKMSDSNDYKNTLNGSTNN
jgi:hypothetical protein